MSHHERVWTVVVGGGSGRRFGTAKQYEMIAGRRVIDRSRATAAIVSDGVVVVVPPADAETESAVAGGAPRTRSVRAGLAAVPDDATIVCVHDAARPLATVALYQRVIAAVAAGASAAVPGVAVTDTIKVVQDGAVVDTPDRSTLVAVQTPQAFRADVLRSAYARAAEDDLDATDDAALVEAMGARVLVVEGEPGNRKITLPEDLEWARRHVAEENA